MCQICRTTKALQQREAAQLAGGGVTLRSRHLVAKLKHRFASCALLEGLSPSSKARLNLIAMLAEGALVSGDPAHLERANEELSRFYCDPAHGRWTVERDSVWKALQKEKAGS